MWNGELRVHVSDGQQVSPFTVCGLVASAVQSKTAFVRIEAGHGWYNHRP